jgi:hypothetical protein
MDDSRGSGMLFRSRSGAAPRKKRRLPRRKTGVETKNPKALGRVRWEEGAGSFDTIPTKRASAGQAGQV